jgi:hypothetical protein
MSSIFVRTELSNDPSVNRSQNQDSSYTPLKGSVVTLLSSARYSLLFLCLFHLAATIQVISIGVFMTAGFGIVNNQLGIHQCIEFFTAGCNGIYGRLIKTDEPIQNSIARGNHRNWIGIVVAGCVLALAARAVKLVVLTAFSMAPFIIALAMIGRCLQLHHIAKSEGVFCSSPGNRQKLDQLFDREIQSSEEDHLLELRQIPEAYFRQIPV